MVCTDGVRTSTLLMRAEYLVQYRVVHPLRPVFDLKERALADFIKQHPALFVVDEHINRLLSEEIDVYCRRYLHTVGKVVIDPGEQSKSWAQVERICYEAIRVSLPRDGFLIGVGGGTTLDLAGLAAALFRRGVRYLRIPTTLVGLVDVGVGVKHGINFAGRKNIMGAFYPPAGAVNDLHLLRTLPKREISCGLAEIIKIAMVCDSRLFELVEAHGSELLESRFQEPREVASEVAIRAEKRMMEQLQNNLFETKMRRVVDFGHTFSPKIETASDFRIAHGEAVAIDMLLSTIIAVERKLCELSVLSRLVRVYRNVSLPMTQSACNYSDFTGSLRETRLHRCGGLHLVVPVGIGSARFVEDLEPSELAAAMTRAHELSTRDSRI